MITITSEIFRLAKQRVEPECCQTQVNGAPRLWRHICYAIGALRDEGIIGPITAGMAKKIINDRLGGHSILEYWLRDHHDIGWPPVGTNEYVAYYDKMQATRHAWLDSLITEFQSKGD